MRLLKNAALAAVVFLFSTVGLAQEEPLEFFGGSISTKTDNGTKLTLFGAHENTKINGNFTSFSARVPMADGKFWEAEYFGYFPKSPLTGHSFEDHRLRAAIGKNWKVGKYKITHRSRLEYRTGQLDEAVRYRPMFKVLRPIRVSKNYITPIYAEYEAAYNFGDERFNFGMFRAGVYFPVTKSLKLELGYIEIRDFEADNSDGGSMVAVHVAF